MCQAAYLTWLMSLRMTEIDKQPQSTYLGMIGLSDMSFVAGIPHGWIACEFEGKWHVFGRCS